MIYFSTPMKVFLSGSPRGKKEYGAYYKKIHAFLTDSGYESVDEDLLDTSYDDFKQQMSFGREAYVNWYQKKIESINQSDICIFETSIHSLGIGFLIQRALEYSKPVIVLYYEDNIPYFLSGVEDEKLIVRQYTNKNYKEIIKKALEVAREKRDKRFNFFLSPKLLQYIDDASREQGVTKSKLLRDMIVRHMRGETA